MILVDTSVWIRHLRARDLQLVRFLREERVVTCQIVIGELLLGSGVPADFEDHIALIPTVPSPTSQQTLEFFDRHRTAFRNTGVGWADAQIIVSAVTAGALLMTRDGPQRTVWKRIGFRLA